MRFFPLSISFSSSTSRDCNLARGRCQAKICLKLDSISAKRSSRSTPPNSSLNPRLREPADIYSLAIFEATSGNRERCMRRRAHPVVVVGSHLRIFQLSFLHRRGSACPGLSYTRRHTRPAGKPRENPRLPFHIS